MSMQNKIRRIHHLSEIITPKKRPYTLVFHLDLFTSEEREHFSTLYTKATAKPLREVWGDLR